MLVGSPLGLRLFGLVAAIFAVAWGLPAEPREQGGAPQWNAAVFWDARGTTQPGTQRSFKAQWWVARSQKEFEIPVLLPFATRKISAAKHTSDRERVSTRAPREMRVNSLLREYGVTGLSAGAGGL